MVTRQERIDAFVMRVYRRLTDRSKSFAKITWHVCRSVPVPMA